MVKTVLTGFLWEVTVKTVLTGRSLHFPLQTGEHKKCNTSRAGGADQ